MKTGTGEAVGQASIGAGLDNGWVPDSEDILGASTLVNPGETTTLVVDLPAGEYDYICTYPGHYMSMKGKLIVK